MYLMVIGALLVIVKALGLGPTANWPWWLVLTPFALVIVWWEVIVPMFHLRERAEKKKSDQERKERAERLYGKKK
jgi:small Trp-rich protein